MSVQDTKSTDDLINQCIPYLRQLFENSPQFGSCGFNVIFHAGQIARVELSATVQRIPRQTTGGRI